MEDAFTGQLLDWDELLAQRQRWQEQDRKVVFTNGVFDILHRGHVEYLLAARSLGHALVVGLNTDASVRRFKDLRRPIVPQEDRALVLTGLRCVDVVAFFEQDTPLELITRLQPDILVKGADYQEDEIVGAEVVRQAGGKVVRIRLTPGKSTSDLIQTILTKYASPSSTTDSANG